MDREVCVRPQEAEGRPSGKGTSGGKVGLVAGATGLVGRELVRSLLRSDVSKSPSSKNNNGGRDDSRPTSEWKLVYGVARHVPDDDDDDDLQRGVDRERYRFVGCNLLDRGETLRKLGPLAGHVTHMFWVTWASQYPLDTPECCDQNRAMLANALDALLPGGGGGGGGGGGEISASASALRHVTLQTGTKHYVALEGVGAGCYEEDSPRVGVGEGGGGRHGGAYNFYYVLEDLVEERLGSSRMEMGWSVHRPGLLLGSSRRSHFNLMGSLCVYGSICRRLGLPFRFCGLRSCWEETYMDASDARLVARQHIWWASEAGGAAGGQAFNAVNGIAFTWKEIWPALAAKFGLPPPPPQQQQDETTTTSSEWVAEGMTYSALMGEEEAMERVWEQMVEAEGLRPTRMEELANWAFLDLVFRFPGKMLASPAKARRLGFTTSYIALDSVLYWVDRMRQDRLIPY